MTQYIVTGRNQGVPRPPHVDLIPDVPNTVFSASFDSGVEAELIGSGLIATYPLPHDVTVRGTPSAGQVPTATSATDATWQDGGGGGGGGGFNPAGILIGGTPALPAFDLASNEGTNWQAPADGFLLCVFSCQSSDANGAGIEVWMGAGTDPLNDPDGLRVVKISLLSTVPGDTGIIVLEQSFCLPIPAGYTINISGGTPLVGMDNCMFLPLA